MKKKIEIIFSFRFNICILNIDISIIKFNSFLINQSELRNI